MYANNWFSNTLKTEKASAYTGTQKDILILTNIYKAKSEIKKKKNSLLCMSFSFQLINCVYPFISSTHLTYLLFSQNSEKNLLFHSYFAIFDFISTGTISTTEETVPKIQGRRNLAWSSRLTDFFVFEPEELSLCNETLQKLHWKIQRSTGNGY